MARYKNAYRDEQEIEEEVVKEEAKVETTDNEEETFKKRYGDLRRFAQQKQTEYEERIKVLEEQVNKKPVQFPKSDEEFESWASKYPDVVANIKTMIMKHGQELKTGIDEKLKRVKELEDNIARQEATQKLHKLHPDFFSDILPDTKFKEWVEEQPANIREALNSWDAHSAGRAIDLYKADMGIAKKKETPSERNAAESVTNKNNSSGPNKNAGDIKFTESQVAAMSPREFEKNEEAIMEAIRTGKFKYDISGAAR